MAKARRMSSIRGSLSLHGNRPARIPDVDAPRDDDFDRWASDRDRGYENSVSARYVSPDVVGYKDLDANGTWRVDAAYGNVWMPNRVAAGWAPYRDGHWSWIDPWGWTWVDDAPWGFAVSHYGRWANLSGTWGWVPGPCARRAYYAPALVAFVGSGKFQHLDFQRQRRGVAWFPLAPREVYRPSYPVSRGYFENVNRSNTVITTTVINDYYNNTNVTNVVYANQQVPARSSPCRHRVRAGATGGKSGRGVPREMVVSRRSHCRRRGADQKSVRGAAARATSRRPACSSGVVARTAPPPPPVRIRGAAAATRGQAGRPLDERAQGIEIRSCQRLPSR